MNTSFFNAVNWWDKIFAVVVALGFVGISVLSQMLGQRPPKYQKIHPNDKKTKQGGQMKWMMIIMNVCLQVCLQATILLLFQALQLD